VGHVRQKKKSLQQRSKRGEGEGPPAAHLLPKKEKGDFYRYHRKKNKLAKGLSHGWIPSRGDKPCPRKKEKNGTCQTHVREEISERLISFCAISARCRLHSPLKTFGSHGHRGETDDGPGGSDPGVLCVISAGKKGKRRHRPEKRKGREVVDPGGRRGVCTSSQGEKRTCSLLPMRVVALSNSTERIFFRDKPKVGGETRQVGEKTNHETGSLFAERERSFR